VKNKKDENKISAIGRTKTVLVTESGTHSMGVVTEIIARASSGDGADRLTFIGPSNFDARSKKHLKSVVLPVVDAVTDRLGLPRRSFEVSVVNLGATASIGVGVGIGGFSADLPLLLALLSSSTGVAIRQDLVSTGHVASPDGDIASVRGIPAKLDAVLASPGVSAFVYPDLEKDSSLALLTPDEYHAAKESLLRHKGDIETYSVGDVHEALNIFMADESIVLGSMRTGFFDASASIGATQNPITKSIKLLVEGNEKRLWDAFEQYLLNGERKRARMLLDAYVDFHIKNERYPEGFGMKLFLLVISLPPSIRKLDDLFPLVSTESCINLSQYAKKSNHEDVRQLYKAASGEEFGASSRQTKSTGAIQLDEDSGEKGLIEKILAELSDDNLVQKIAHPIDEARGRFVMSSVTINDGFEFNETITAFFTHMFRHTSSPVGNLERSALSTDALELLEEAFEHKGGYRAALSEGRYGTNGGMRRVFDMITEHLKQKEKEKFIKRVFNESVDPSDWDAKVRLTEILQERIEPYLPDVLKGLPARKLAHHWEEIIRGYVESIDKVSDLIRKF
jgi:hypothetical protein